MVRTLGKPVEEIAALTWLDLERSGANSIEKGQIDDPDTSCWWGVAEGYEPIPKYSKISGEYWLDEDYYLAFVPPYADLTFTQSPNESSADSPGTIRQNETIRNSYSLIPAFVGIVQALWAIATIYQARGNQIQVYGYAAFGLTVVPYAFMSVVNSMANLLTPQYATISVIRTPTMTEAEQRGKASFKAALDVDLLKVPASAMPWVWTPPIQALLPLLLGLVPLSIIGGLSKFQAGNSTSLQRGFTMAWLVVGIVSGSEMPFITLGDPMEGDKKKETNGKRVKKVKKHRSFKEYLIEETACESSTPDLAVFLLTLFCSTPAIGGMVLVGLMVKEYGNCYPLG